ncbi:hypothetical protein [Photobacterium satsumensis]|uniref:hypothetical protein n=1 Tax=Photobacterium satsumensis TaxID=2910239 RepID=UPI003D12D0EC
MSLEKAEIEFSVAAAIIHKLITDFFISSPLIYESANSQVGVSLEGMTNQEKTVMYGHPIQTGFFGAHFYINIQTQAGLKSEIDTICFPTSLKLGSGGTVPRFC